MHHRYGESPRVSYGPNELQVLAVHKQNLMPAVTKIHYHVCTILNSRAARAMDVVQLQVITREIQDLMVRITPTE